MHLPCQNDKKITDFTVKNFNTGSKGLSISLVAPRKRNSPYRAKLTEKLYTMVMYR